MQTILITGARAPIALEMARSFHRIGHRVIMADSLHLTVSRWSNSVSKYYVTPSPRYEIDKYILHVQSIILVENVTHFIPTCEDALFVAANKKSFDCKVWTSTKELMLKLHNKHWFSQFASEQLNIPETILLDQFIDWENSDQYVFKPCYSRFASSIIIGKKLSENYFSKVEKSKWIAQRRILGFEICVYSIWDHGELKAYAAYHPLYKAGKGAGIFFEPVQNKTVFDNVNSFGSKINYTGHLCFDVIIDHHGTPFFIECNPRGTSGAHLINFKLANAYLGKEFYRYQSNNEFCIMYAMAILHPLSFLKSRIIKAKDCIFDTKDLKPFFFQILSLVEISYIKLTKGTTWLEATTGDIEWNGDES
jgi:hypothetical protein